jgi:disulfide oxidoreductase YuzD
MKVIYLNDTIQYIASIDEKKANKIIQSGIVRAIKKGEDVYPYVVIENETIEDNVNNP